eukprot:3145703-Rhodomonas_salina.1
MRSRGAFHRRQPEPLPPLAEAAGPQRKAEAPSVSWGVGLKVPPVLQEDLRCTTDRPWLARL